MTGEHETPGSTGRPLEAGELVLLVDTKGRRYLLDLQVGGKFHSHSGILDHDAVIGGQEGVAVSSSGGQSFRIVRPTLAEFVLKMKRGAQVIYPKDLGPILMWADVFPGARVVESGLGSGALTMALLRAVGPTGHVTSYELREDHAVKGLANVRRFMGDASNHTLRIGDVYEGIDERDVDRIVFDLPQPWLAVPHAATALRLGGIVLTYLPTVPQVQQCVDALQESGFGFVETFEVLHRGWNIDGRSVRPDHRMVAHTGFLTVGRLLEPA